VESSTMLTMSPLGSTCVGGRHILTDLRRPHVGTCSTRLGPGSGSSEEVLCCSTETYIKKYVSAFFQ